MHCSIYCYVIFFLFNNILFCPYFRNALIYGAKKWILYPPHNMIMSNKQMLEYFETDLQAFKKYVDIDSSSSNSNKGSSDSSTDEGTSGVHPFTCVQTAGDVMIVPESWGHGVLNIQESVAIATELKAALFRVRPTTRLTKRFSAAPERIPPHAPPPPPRQLENQNQKEIPKSVLRGSKL